MIVGLLGKAGSGKDLIASLIAPVHLALMDGNWQNVDELVDPDGAQARVQRAIHGHAVQLSFADPVKVIARDLYAFNHAQLWGPSEQRNAIDDRYGRSPRAALQRLATAAREYNPDTWLDLGLRRADALQSAPRMRKPQGAAHFSSSWLVERTDLVLFSDVRFHNEVAKIRAAGGEVWKIVRPGAGLQGEAGQHVSETEQDSISDDLFAHAIINDGTVDDLRRRCLALLR